MKPLVITRRKFVVAASVASLGYRALAQGSKPKVGCQANGFIMKTQDFSGLLPAIQSMKDLGYAGFECNARFVQSEFANAGEARKKLQAIGIEFVGMHTSMADAAKGGLAALCQGGASLGVHYVVMSGNGLSPTGVFTDDAAKEKAAALDGYGKICKENNVRLAYHNHTPEFANKNAEIQALADHTDPEVVSFLMDAGHGYQGGGNPAEFMLKNSRRIVGCHIKTFKNKTEQVPLGQGDFGFEDLAAAVRKTGWSGWLMDEEGNGRPDGGHPDRVGPDREYIRKVFGV